MVIIENMAALSKDMLFSTFVEEKLNRPQRSHSTYFNKIERMLKQMLNMFASAFKVLRLSC